MAGKLPMGQKVLLRSRVMGMVNEGQISLKEASVRLKIGYRQAERIRCGTSARERLVYSMVYLGGSPICDQREVREAACSAGECTCVAFFRV